MGYSNKLFNVNYSQGVSDLTIPLKDLYCDFSLKINAF